MKCVISSLEYSYDVRHLIIAQPLANVIHLNDAKSIRFIINKHIFLCEYNGISEKKVKGKYSNHDFNISSTQLELRVSKNKRNQGICTQTETCRNADRRIDRGTNALL